MSLLDSEVAWTSTECLQKAEVQEAATPSDSGMKKMVQTSFELWLATAQTMISHLEEEIGRDTQIDWLLIVKGQCNKKHAIRMNAF